MKLILTLTLSILAFATYSQDSIPRNVRALRVYSGLPLERIGSTDSWYNPDFEIGADINHSVRLKNEFYLSMGIGMNYSQFRTHPFVREWTTYSYSNLIGVYNVQHHSDNYERETRGSFLNIRVPLRLEYMPKGKWKPYARLGVMFDAEVFSQSKDVYAGTNSPAPLANSYSQKYLYPDDLLLSGTMSGGIKHQYKDLELLFGLTSQVGFYAFNNDFDVNRFAIGAEFCIRKGLKKGIVPNKGLGKRVRTKEISTRYVYVELIGFVSTASLNFERTTLRRNKFRINHRVGFGIVVPDEPIFSLPIGMSAILGENHGFEMGCDFVPTIGDMFDSFLVPRIGYRAEVLRNFLMRINLTGWYMLKDSDFFVVPSLSIGTRF